MKTKPNTIDIVMPWVNGTDREWQDLKAKYSDSVAPNNKGNSVNRYRDWDNLQYVFHSIETFMPWVRKVHFVTNGQRPGWLNEEYTKLNWVKHEDFVPSQYRPTFSANPIELNLHRISGLSERFIFFNDDFFITQPTKKTDFFDLNGLPKDQSVLLRVPGATYDDIFGHILLNDIGLINQNFKRNDVLKKHFFRLFSPKNGLLAPLLSATYLPTNHFPGFMVPHMPQSYLKSVFEEVWQKESEILDATCKNKFRGITDVNQYIMREWQFVTGQFEPTNILKSSKYFSIFPEQLEQADEAIRSGKYRMICINDVEIGNFEDTKHTINNSLLSILPSKSRFEL